MMDKILCGDNVEIMKSLPDNCIDLTVTSPPYDNLRTYNGFTWDFEAVAEQLFRITKDGGIVVWIVNDATVKGSETGTSFRQALYFKDVGFKLNDTMIWSKESTAFPDNYRLRYYSSFEYMFVFSKGKPKTVNLIEDRKNKQAGKKVIGSERRPNGSFRTASGVRVGRKIKEYGVRWNVWVCPTSNNDGWVEHPAKFPEQLVRDHIISWSNEGDLVFDPFLGSGTTAKVARDLGRHYLGCDISEEYCELARKRLELAATVS